MRFLVGLLAAAIASPAAAAPQLDRQDWERFLQPATPSEQVFFDWLGRVPELDTEGAEGRHYLVQGKSPYLGGIDCYASLSGEVQSVLWYLTAGPLYLDSQIRHAATLRTPWTLQDVERWYGQPAARSVSKRNGTKTWTYHFQGDRTRSLEFSSLPGSSYLYRVIVTRGAE